MGLPSKVTACCCGCSLRFWATFIGFLYGIATLASTISLYLQAQNLSRWKFDNNDDYINEYSLSLVKATVSAIMLLTSVCLVLGAVQNKASYVRVWISINGVILMMEAVVYFGAIIGLFLDKTKHDGHVSAQVTGYLFLLSVKYYFLMVVNSYHNSLLPHDVISHTQHVAAHPVCQPTRQPAADTVSQSAPLLANTYPPALVHVPVPVQAGQLDDRPPTYTEASLQGIVVVRD